MFGVLSIPNVNAQQADGLVWQLRHFQFEEFTLEVPFGFEDEGQKKDDSDRRYVGTVNGIYLYAFSDSPTKQKQFKFVSSFIRDAGNSSLDAPATAGQDAQVEFLDRFGYYNRIWAVRTQNRIYTFQTVSTSKENGIANKFLSGIKFRGVEANISYKLVNDNSSQENANIEVGTKNEQLASNSKPTSGNGIGAGNGPGDAAAIPKSVVKFVPVKILDKPSPPYTNYARFYNLEGSVLLRLTLLANGEVGSVTPITTLPFGLTESAVQAARKVRFEASTLDGIPRTVTKSFLYSFRIY